MTTTALDYIKLGIHVATGVGVSKIVNDIIQNNTSVETTADAVKVWTGSLVIGSIVAEKSSQHVDAKLDKFIAWNEKRKSQSVDSTEYVSPR